MQLYKQLKDTNKSEKKLILYNLSLNLSKKVLETFAKINIIIKIWVIIIYIHIYNIAQTYIFTEIYL